MGSAHPPLEHLLTSSIVSLESFELSRLNAVANLRKEFRQIVDEWIEAEIEARLSRWILERRRQADPESRPSAPPLPEGSARILQAGGDPSRADSESVDHAQPSDPQAFSAESRGATDPPLAAPAEQSAPFEEGAAGALRWLERFARTQGESLHCRLSDLVEQQIAEASRSPETQPLQVQFDWHAARALPQQSSEADQNSRSASGNPSRGQVSQVGEGSAGQLAAARAIAPRKIDHNGQRSIAQSQVATRPPVRQIPLFRARIASAS